jgi:ATP-dependent Zn protease
MQHFLLYIDPGSGSYLIQMIIAGILGVAFFFKNIMFAVKHFFQRIFGKKS